MLKLSKWSWLSYLGMERISLDSIPPDYGADSNTYIFQMANTQTYNI